tara:strand:+ start:17097 stop:18290 length:1194 start_codon:yes stop_codon:yes gene_type:complete
MGYNSTSSVLTAKFTPIGRERMISSNSGLITKFALGDSDANYYTTLPLIAGQIPSAGGDLTSTSGVSSNSITTNVRMIDQLYATPTSFVKNVEVGSARIVTEHSRIGQTTQSWSAITINEISRSALTTDRLVNLYKSFRLPITSINDNTFTGKTLNQGGYSNTALSGMATTKIIAVSVPESSYGDMLDGKAVHVTLSGTTGGTYEIYSTFQKQGNAAAQDNSYTEMSTQTSSFGTNYAFLFSDQIKRPNGDATKSWSTGFDMTKTFTANNKERYNLQTSTNAGQTADTAVGIVYLDKGIAVITDPTIINDVTVSAQTGSSVVFNSVSTSVSQEIICIAGRGQFVRSNNPTFTDGDTPRISEIGLYDNNGTLIAYGKTDAHITKTGNELKVFAVRINI